jgi:hypothetical protein
VQAYKDEGGKNKPWGKIPMVINLENLLLICFLYGKGNMFSYL